MKLVFDDGAIDEIADIAYNLGKKTKVKLTVDRETVRAKAGKKYRIAN